MKRTQRRGFTLFHLLILLALFAILLGLMLPAVAKVRQSAAKAQSQNNLKQIGIGIHAYASANDDKVPLGVDANGFSAAAYLLPYIEQDAVFKSIDFKKSVDDKANADARKTVIKTFLSPNDPLKAVTMDYGATNYLFNAGSKYSLDDNNGIFYGKSKYSIGNIPDGSSNTLMAGETLKGDNMVKATDLRRQHVGLKKGALKELTEESGVAEWKDDKNIAADRCASWMDGRFLQGTFTGTRKVNDDKPDVNCGGQGGLSALRSFQNVGLVAMMDGSVRTVSMKTTLEVWKNLACADDGNVLPNDF